MTEDQEMMDILQSFIDLAEPKLDKYKELEEDVKATKWAINKIKELEKENKKLKAFKKRFKVVERLDLPKDTDYVIMTKVDYERNIEQMLEDLEKRYEVYGKRK